MTAEVDQDLASDIENSLAQIAMRHARDVGDEYGLLYHKLKNFHDKYQRFPTHKSITKIKKNIAIDFIRKETKTRNKKGVLCGSGVGKSFVSIYIKVLSDDTNTSDCLIDTIEDATSRLPNDIIDFSKEQIMAGLSEKETAAIEQRYLDNSFRESPIKTICVYYRNRAIEKMRENCRELFSFNPNASNILLPSPDEARLSFPREIKPKTKKTPKDKIFETCSANLCRKIYQDMLDTGIKFKDAVVKYNLSAGSFRQTLCKLKLSMTYAEQLRQKKLYAPLWKEWLDTNLSLNAFCRTKNIFSASMVKWLKKEGLYEVYKEKSWERNSGKMRENYLKIV